MMNYEGQKKKKKKNSRNMEVDAFERFEEEESLKKEVLSKKVWAG